MAEVTLTAGIRSNLSSLQRTSKQMNVIQERLATGRTVNNAVDNPTNFFAAANLNDRASLLSARLDGMGQAVSSLQTADNTVTAMRSIISAMKGVADSALANPDSDDRSSLGKQFNELLVQLNDLAGDASYNGTNLLVSTQSDRTSGGTESLTVQFNERFDVSTLSIQGVNIATATGAGTAGFEMNDSGELNSNSYVTGARTIGTATSVSSQSFAITLNVRDSTIVSGGTGSGNQSVVGIRSADVTGTAVAAEMADGTGPSLSFVDEGSYQSNLKQMVTDIEFFDQGLVSTSKGLAQNINIVSIRQEFTTDLINTLQEGSDKLTLADLNEEGANLLALQTAQQLGIQSLSLASQANQGVLSILG